MTPSKAIVQELRGFQEHATGVAHFSGEDIVVA
jgi:hypothetical protein